MRWYERVRYCKCVYKMLRASSSSLLSLSVFFPLVLGKFLPTLQTKPKGEQRRAFCRMSMVVDVDMYFVRRICSTLMIAYRPFDLIYTRTTCMSCVHDVRCWFGIQNNQKWPMDTATHKLHQTVEGFFRNIFIWYRCDNNNSPKYEMQCIQTVTVAVLHLTRYSLFSHVKCIGASANGMYASNKWSIEEKKLSRNFPIASILRAACHCHPFLSIRIVWPYNNLQCNFALSHRVMYFAIETTW